MDSEWWVEWLRVWIIHWRHVWSHFGFYIEAWLAGDWDTEAYYREELVNDVRLIAEHIAALVEHGVTEVMFPWEEWANDFIANFEAWLLGLLGIEVEPDTPPAEQLLLLWLSIGALWAKFGDVLLDTPMTVVDWVNERITGVYDSIIRLFSLFGPAFLEGEWTVVSWVEDKVTAVVQWVLSMYETARLQADAAATWIATHGQVLADWLTEHGENLVTWYNDHASFYTLLHDLYGVTLVEWLYKYASYYMDLYDKYHDLLLEFLQDPGAFILGYVGDLWVVPPEEEDPNWLLWLLKLILNPIGTVLGWIGVWHKLIADWIMEWLEENFAPIETILASIVPPDLGLPTVEDWNKGLREPETDEEKAYVALLDTKLQQILDETIGDHPLTAEEFASLIFSVPEGAET